MEFSNWIWLNALQLVEILAGEPFKLELKRVLMLNPHMFLVYVHQHQSLPNPLNRSGSN